MAETKVTDDLDIVDKAALLADEEFELATYAVPGLGNIQYRGLSRMELMRVAKLGQENGIQSAEAYMVSRACVEPKMSVDDVKKWQSRPRGKHIEGLVEEINEASGVNEGAGKEATLRFPD